MRGGEQGWARRDPVLLRSAADCSPSVRTPLPAEGGAAGGSGHDSREGREKHKDAFPPSTQQPKQVRYSPNAKTALSFVSR